MPLLQLTITSSTSLFAAVDDTLHDSRPSGDGKATYSDNDDALKYLNKFSRVMASTHGSIFQPT